MGKISDTYIGNLMDVAFGSQASTFPATLYLGLSTTAPTNSGGNITEPGGNGYARVSVANNNTTWPNTGTDRTKSNGIAIAFPTATGSWGTISHWVVMTASSGGAMIAWGELTTPLAVGDTVTPTFAIGDIVISSPSV